MDRPYYLLISMHSLYIVDQQIITTLTEYANCAMLYPEMEENPKKGSSTNIFSSKHQSNLGDRITHLISSIPHADTYNYN